MADCAAMNMNIEVFKGLIEPITTAASDLGYIVVVLREDNECVCYIRESKYAWDHTAIWGEDGDCEMFMSLSLGAPLMRFDMADPRFVEEMSKVFDRYYE